MIIIRDGQTFQLPSLESKPPAPAEGRLLYVRAGALYIQTPDGTETAVGGGGGGTEIAAGASFPGSPSEGDYFYRTDLARLFRYDGTGWGLTNTLPTLNYTLTATATGSVSCYDVAEMRTAPLTIVRDDGNPALVVTDPDDNEVLVVTPAPGESGYSTQLSGGARVICFVDGDDNDRFFEVFYAGGEGHSFTVDRDGIHLFPVNKEIYVRGNPVYLDKFTASFASSGPGLLQQASAGAAVTVGHYPIGTILLNGAMNVWQRGTSSVTCTAGTNTYRCDRWGVLSVGGNVACERSATVPATGRSLYSLQVTGASGVTSCFVSQRIEAINTPRTTVTFSAWVRASTARTPVFKVRTPSAADNWTTNTERASHSFGALTANTWTYVSHTFDTSALTDISNGLSVGIDWGTHTSGTAMIAEAKLEYGSIATPITPPTYTAELAACQRYYNQLDTKGLNGIVVLRGFAYARHYVNSLFVFPVEMRAAPTGNTTTATWSTNGAANTVAAYNYNTEAYITLTSGTTVSLQVFNTSPISGVVGYHNINFSGFTDGNNAGLQWGSGITVPFDAEL